MEQATAVEMFISNRIGMYWSLSRVPLAAVMIVIGFCLIAFAFWPKKKPGMKRYLLPSLVLGGISILIGVIAFFF